MDTYRDTYLSAAAEALSETDQRYVERSTAHSAHRDTLRADQRFRDGVTDLDVARVMLQLERGIPFRLAARGWFAPAGTSGRMPRQNLVVDEMIRTGLVRDYRNPRTQERVLIPAKTHLERDGQSACLFLGEDLGPMRSRLVRDMLLVDCLHCEEIACKL